MIEQRLIDIRAELQDTGRAEVTAFFCRRVGYSVQQLAESMDAVAEAAADGRGWVLVAKPPKLSNPGVSR